MEYPQSACPGPNVTGDAFIIDTPNNCSCCHAIICDYSSQVQRKRGSVDFCGYPAYYPDGSYPPNYYRDEYFERDEPINITYSFLALTQTNTQVSVYSSTRTYQDYLRQVYPVLSPPPPACSIHCDSDGGGTYDEQYEDSTTPASCHISQIGTLSGDPCDPSLTWSLPTYDPTGCSNPGIPNVFYTIGTTIYVQTETEDSSFRTDTAQPNWIGTREFNITRERSHKINDEIYAATEAALSQDTWNDTALSYPAEMTFTSSGTRNCFISQARFRLLAVCKGRVAKCRWVIFNQRTSTTTYSPEFITFTVFENDDVLSYYDFVSDWHLSPDLDWGDLASIEFRIQNDDGTFPPW